MQLTSPVTLSLTYLRKRINLRQEDIAFRLGLSRITIVRWESGQTKPSSEHVRQLAKIYGVPEWIIEDCLRGATEEVA